MGPLDNRTKFDIRKQWRELLPTRRVASFFIVVCAAVLFLVLVTEREESAVIIAKSQNVVLPNRVDIPENTGWEDLLEQQAKLEQEVAKSKTQTDRVSESLLANYIALKQSGKLNDESAIKVLSQSLGYLEGTSTVLYAEGDLTIISDSGLESISDYGEALGGAFKEVAKSGGIDEVIYVTRAAQTNDPKLLEAIKPNVAIYKRFVKRLLATPVPKAFVLAHLDLVNNANIMADELPGFQLVFTDPLVALKSIGTYNDSLAVFNKALKATVEYVEQGGVQYGQGTGGFFLLNYK